MDNTFDYKLGKALLFINNKALLAICDDLLLLANRVCSRNDHIVDKSNLVELVTAYLFSKSYKTMKSILLLSEEGFGEDACCLLRVLFENTVNILYINKEDSLARATRYVEHSSVTKIYAYDHYPTWIRDALIDSSESIATLRVDRDVILAKYGGEKFVKSWSGYSIDVMASMVGLGDDYSTVYDICCDLAHTRINASNHYVREEESTLIFDAGQSDRLVDAALIFASRYFILILQTWNKVFALGINTDLESIHSKMETYLKTKNH